MFNLKFCNMNNYKPYSYLYKHESEPATLKSRFITQIPADKKLALRSGDPSTVGSITYIRYNIENELGSSLRQEEFKNEFSWDGNSHEVHVVIGSGSDDGGGESVMGSDDAEVF